MRPLHLKYMLVLLLSLQLAGCASQGEVLEDQGGTDFRERIQEQTQDGVTVRAGVPSAKEAEALFGMKLYKRGVQPVWIEIENNRDQDLGFLPVGLDPAYFTPIETANIDLRSEERKARDMVREKALFKAGMGTHILAGTKRSGFVFSRLDEGTKAFNVDVLGETFFRFSVRFVTFSRTRFCRF